MSKKDRERAARGEIFRQTVQAQKCAIPQCSERADSTNPFQVCGACAKIIYTLIYALPRIQVKPIKPKQEGILIPKPGMADAAIQEARRTLGRSP